MFAAWGIDSVKLVFITPGSPDNGGDLPPDNSGSVIAFHKAIEPSGRQIRLDISWKLERNETYFNIWEDNADSMRTDQNINNSGSTTLVDWATVQRAIDNYRQYIVQVSKESNYTLSIYPVMDNLYIGNAEAQTGVSDVERQTMATHWIGVGANLILGSDLTNVDDLGKALVTNPAALEVVEFTQKYSMQPRNPGTGEQDARQLQAWIAGPDEGGKAVVVLANYGPDRGQGGFGTKMEGDQDVHVSWEHLGIMGTYSIQSVWSAESMRSSDTGVSATLGEGHSMLLTLTLG